MHPSRTSTLLLIVAGIVLYLLAASGEPDRFWPSGPSWLGWIGWIGFLICALLLIISGVYWVVSLIRHRERPSTL